MGRDSRDTEHRRDLDRQHIAEFDRLKADTHSNFQRAFEEINALKDWRRGVDETLERIVKALEAVERLTEALDAKVAHLEGQLTKFTNWQNTGPMKDLAVAYKSLVERVAKLEQGLVKVDNDEDGD